MNYLRLFMAGFGVSQAVRLIAYEDNTAMVGIGVLFVPIFVTYGVLAWKNQISQK